jgi:hypothetical protein
MTDSYDASAILAEFDALHSFMDAVTQALADGQMPDLRSIERRVAVLCDMIKVETSNARQSEYRAALGDLLQRLDSCEAQMRAFQKAHAKRQS